MNEQWQDIPVYTKRYQASNLGRIRSLNRSVSQSRRRGVRKVKGQILTSISTSNGYLVVFIDKRAKRIHRLVLEAFVGPCPKGQESRHLDSDRQNNCLDNLCWGTRSENAQDRLKTGYRGVQCKPVRRGDGKIFKSATEAAQAIGTSQGNVSCICRGIGKTIKGYSFEYMEEEDGK